VVRSDATTVKGYLAQLDAGRRKEIEAVRKVIVKHLPAGFEEVMDFGMICYVVPLATYPDTYNGHPLPIAGLAAQKNYNSVYLMSVYGDPAIKTWFEAAYKSSGKKLDMGKGCVRFRRAQDLPLEVIAQAVARVPVDTFVARVRAARPGR
jgi:hypothetical protein